jgi:translation initiation factor 2 subunit 2
MEDEQMMSLFKNKKKRKNKDENQIQEEELTYDEMLRRLFQNLEPSSSSKKLRLQPPRLALIGTKRTGWSNFESSAENLKRDPMHLSSFVENELGTTVSHAKEGLLVMKGRFKIIQIERILKKYVEKYVKCKTCQSSNTELVKNQLTRLTSMQCEDCKSEWTVENIQKAFHASKKDDSK